MTELAAHPIEESELPAYTVCAILPIHIKSEANGRDHWRKKAARAKLQRSTAAWQMRTRGVPPIPPLTIMLTRIAPRDLDSDNLAGGFKAVRDGVADWLGVDDGDKRLTWLYGQRRGSPGVYACEVAVIGGIEA